MPIDEAPELYSHIVASVIRSVMLAQREFVLSLVAGKSISDVPNAAVNRHFSWMALEIAEGKNRHLTEPGLNQFPLRTSALRNPKGTPEKILSLLRARKAPDSGVRWKLRSSPQQTGQIDMANVDNYIRFESTRISTLVRASFSEFAQENRSSLTDDDGLVTSSRFAVGSKRLALRDSIMLRSALAIAYDFLTMPGLPATRAYALVSLRNFIFNVCGAVPDISTGWPASKPSKFNTRDIGDALSRIKTSTRERFYSHGMDKLPRSGRHIADVVLRQFLLMKGAFNCRFDTTAACLRYLLTDPVNEGNSLRKNWGSDKALLGNTYELSKRPQIDKLPDLGEIVNELLGLPIPLRGADTIFCGGIKFTANEGLVVALHGGPGTGKTSLALGICACVAPFGMDSLFISAEEHEDDLRSRMYGLVPEDIRRLSFFGEVDRDLVRFEKIGLLRLHATDDNLLPDLVAEIKSLATSLEKKRLEVLRAASAGIPKPCNVVVVLDGLHDLFAASGADVQTRDETQIRHLYGLIDALRKLKALVIVTTGADTAINSSLDYLVDIAIHLTHDSISEYSAKPDRRIKLTKARHQLAASGTHGLKIAGLNGVRLSPQINYQLDRRAIWKLRIPDVGLGLNVLRRAVSIETFTRLAARTKNSRAIDFCDQRDSATIFAGSHVFINGQGSSGKAALALKLALAPLMLTSSDGTLPIKLAGTPSRRVLVVSFLYPLEYYANLSRRLRLLHRWEYGEATSPADARLRVIHLHPGHVRPNDLYNKIDWELEAAELEGAPYSSVVIDGIHNVFVQFPEIQRYSLFWPQLYNSLRSHGILTITTHTILRAPDAVDQSMASFRLDDDRSEPLRNALVQKTDFQIEVDPFPKSNIVAEVGSPTSLMSDLFVVKTMSAIGQSIPKRAVLWSREQLVLIETPLPSAGVASH